MKRKVLLAVVLVLIMGLSVFAGTASASQTVTVEMEGNTETESDSTSSDVVDGSTITISPGGNTDVTEVDVDVSTLGPEGEGSYGSISAGSNEGDTGTTHISEVVGTTEEIGITVRAEYSTTDLSRHISWTAYAAAGDVGDDVFTEGESFASGSASHDGDSGVTAVTMDDSGPVDFQSDNGVTVGLKITDANRVDSVSTDDDMHGDYYHAEILSVSDTTFDFTLDGGDGTESVSSSGSSSTTLSMDGTEIDVSGSGYGNAHVSWTNTWKTENPTVTIDGETIQYSGLLAEGETHSDSVTIDSDSYDVTTDADELDFDVEIDTETADYAFETDGSASFHVDELPEHNERTGVYNLNLPEEELFINTTWIEGVTLSGGFDSFEVWEMNANEAETDFTYTASTFTELEINGLDPEQRYMAADGDTLEVLDLATADSSGTVIFDDLPVSNQPVSVQVAPEELRIYDESNPEELIDDREITAEIFDLDGDSITTKTTTDGTIDLGDLDESTFAVRLIADDYHDRQIIIRDIFQQNSAFMLDDTGSVDTVSPQFVIDDETGNFPPASTRVFIQRGLTIDGETNWYTIAAEEAGVDGYRETLEEGVRYRIMIENPEGDARTLGKFTAQDDATTALTVEGATIEFGTDIDGVGWGATYEERDDNLDRIWFNYSDETDNTLSLDVEIYERGNESNVLFEDTFTGPIGTVQVVEHVPEDNTTEWVVAWEATRDGEDLSGEQFVGPRSVLDPPLDDTLKHVASIGLMLFIGGLASRANAAAVAVALAGVAGVLWYIAWLPAAVSGGMIVLALTVGAIYITQAGRGP